MNRSLKGDGLTAGGFNGRVPGQVPLEPEQRLVLAILEDAVACFQQYIHYRGGIEESLFREAEAWLLEGSSPWVFSFENICDFLGFSPKYLRQGLQRWREQNRIPSCATPMAGRRYFNWH